MGKEEAMMKAAEERKAGVVKPFEASCSDTTMRLKALHDRVVHAIKENNSVIETLEL